MQDFTGRKQVADVATGSAGATDGSYQTEYRRLPDGRWQCRFTTGNTWRSIENREMRQHLEAGYQAALAGLKQPEISDNLVEAIAEKLRDWNLDKEYYQVYVTFARQLIKDLRLVQVAADQPYVTSPLDGMNPDYDKGFTECRSYMLQAGFVKVDKLPIHPVQKAKPDPRALQVALKQAGLEDEQPAPELGRAANPYPKTDGIGDLTDGLSHRRWQEGADAQAALDVQLVAELENKLAEKEAIISDLQLRVDDAESYAESLVDILYIDTPALEKVFTDQEERLTAAAAELRRLREKK